MSSLVSDFLINPVLRQARRFSRSSATSNDQADPLTNQRQTTDSNIIHNEGVIFETPEVVGILGAREDGEGAISTISNGPVVESPMDEDGGLHAELAERHGSDSTQVPERSRSFPLRLASLRSDIASIDDDVSDNPSFITQERFRNESSMSSSMSSTVQNGTSSRMDTSDDSSQLPNQEATSRGDSRNRNSSLPEDDGMKEMRRKIVSIQSMNVDAGRKARLMHQLLTEEYNNSQTSLHTKQPARAPSPASLISQDRPSTPGSLSSFSFWQSNESAPDSSPVASAKMTFQLSADDLKPTFAPYKPRETREGSDEIEASEPADIGEEPEALEELSLGCQHYKRNVKMQCFTCNRWYTCRFCHDAAEDHTLNRKETRHMLCMLCGCAQNAGEICIECGVRSAWYYCNKCKLWDDDVTKSIYHCDDCGICRVGAGLGKDYMHCKTCGVCILISKEHKCIERASDCDCPICGEYLFNSPQTVVFMKCGHTIHQKCYRELMKTSYKCPLCSQSVVNMESQFRNLDRAIESQPMPPGFQDTQAMVSCNDCYAKSIVKYHWLGLKCAVCDSYNTAQLQIMSDPVQPLHSGPADEDIIPGPRADLFLENMHRQQAAANAAQENRDFERSIAMAMPSQARRHSHGQAGTLSPTARFDGYPLAQRLGRSVSPVRGLGFGEPPIVLGRQTEFENNSDEDEDDMDFWGGEGRRRSRQEPEDVVMEDDDDGDDEEESDDSAADDDDDDEEDEEDRMDLFGHR